MTKGYITEYGIAVTKETVLGKTYIRYQWCPYGFGTGGIGLRSKIELGDKFIVTSHDGTTSTFNSQAEAEGATTDLIIHEINDLMEDMWREMEKYANEGNND